MTIGDPLHWSQRIEGYHDYPECRGNASIVVNNRPWFVSVAEGSDYHWDGAPTVGELKDDGLADILTDPNLEDDHVIEEDDIVREFMDHAHEVCEAEERQYDAEEMERRIDHIVNQIEWDSQRVRRDYPRDFANEFDLVVVLNDDADNALLDEAETRAVLERWLDDGDHYGDLLDDLDTYSPW